MTDTRKHYTGPEALQEAVNAEIRSGERLEELGFAQDNFGQWFADNCRVLLYRSCGEWEIDIRLPNGSAVGFDTKQISGKTALEIEAARVRRHNRRMKNGRF
jgi:hypothetical protein